MDFQYVLLIIAVLFMLAIIFYGRKNIQLQGLFPILYFVMWRTQRGLKFMDRLAQGAPRFWTLLFGIGIVVGFGGMVMIVYELVKTTLALFVSSGAAPGVEIVLPVPVKGVHFVPFVYWILSIFIIALVHEFCHGIAARVFKMPVKSAGLAFLGILVPLVPAAFVEPDENLLKKQSRFKQLSVFAAGPFANIIMAGIAFLLIVSIANPLAQNMLVLKGVRVADVEKDSPAAIAGLHKDDVIIAADGAAVVELENLTSLLRAKKPGESISLQTNTTSYVVKLGANPRNASLAYLGLSSRQHAEITPEFKSKYGEWSVPVILWFFGLLYWLFLLSFGIGLFNLLPVGPLDGGRMFAVAAQRLSPRWGEGLWKWTSAILLFLVIVNVVAGFLG